MSLVQRCPVWLRHQITRSSRLSEKPALLTSGRRLRLPTPPAHHVVETGRPRVNGLAVPASPSLLITARADSSRAGLQPAGYGSSSRSAMSARRHGQFEPRVHDPCVLTRPRQQALRCVSEVVLGSVDDSCPPGIAVRPTAWRSPSCGPRSRRTTSSSTTPRSPGDARPSVAGAASWRPSLASGVKLTRP